MKQPTFLEGVSVAIATSLAGGVLYAALNVVFPGVPVLRLLIAGISLAYVVYLLSRSPERVGRITAVAAWLLIAGVLWFTKPPLLFYVCVHLGAIWLIRSLCQPPRLKYSVPISAPGVPLVPNPRTRPASTCSTTTPTR